MDSYVSFITPGHTDTPILTHPSNLFTDTITKGNNMYFLPTGLDIYQDTFRKHLYADMERVRRIWEVELTAVLEIQRVGHRRRILASVAGRQNGPVSNSNMEDIKADLNNLVSSSTSNVIKGAWWMELSGIIKKLNWLTFRRNCSAFS